MRHLAKARLPRLTARRLYAAVALCILVGVAASAAFAAPAARLAGPATWTMRLQQDWPSLDPYVDAGRNLPWAVASPAYDRLITLGPSGAGGKYQPYLATSWKQTAKSVQFKLRRDAKCADGHVLTAVDMLNSIKRFIFVPKRNGSVSANSMGGLGPGPYHLHASNQKSLLTISVDSPFRNLLGMLANLPIICPAGLAAAQQDSHALENQTYGSGPYTLGSAVHGDQITFKLRSDWKWGPPGTSTSYLPQTLVYKVVGDDTAAANLLLTGALDAAYITGPDVDRLIASSSLTHTSVPNYNIMPVAFNMKPGRLLADDEGVRKALATAIDPAKLLQSAFAGRGEVTYGPFRKGQDCYDPSLKAVAPRPDIDAANRILTQDGWTLVNGKRVKGGETLKLTLLTTPLLNSGPDYLVATLNALGVELDFRNLAGSAYGAAYVGAQFDIAPSRGSQVLSEPGAGSGAWTGLPPTAGSNYSYTGQSDPLFVRYWKAGLQNVGKGGCKYFSLATKLLLQHAYVGPTVAWNFDVFARKGAFMPAAPPDGEAFPVFYLNKPGK
jgi:peptide/nickel transport system substrate-binding protein